MYTLAYVFVQLFSCEKKHIVAQIVINLQLRQRPMLFYSGQLQLVSNLVRILLGTIPLPESNPSGTFPFGFPEGVI